MARDYKNRGRARHVRKPKPSIPIWRWLAALTAIAAFALFLYWLGSRPATNNDAFKLLPPAETKSIPEAKSVPKPEPVEPQFKFYNILPEKEVVIPDPEIKTRKREEALGKAKPGNYILQAGSFRSYKDADKLKAQLALLGVEATIETAKVGNTTWNRVRSGPYRSMAAVDKIRDRLRQNHIDVAVMKQSP